MGKRLNGATNLIFLGAGLALGYIVRWCDVFWTQPDLIPRKYSTGAVVGVAAAVVVLLPP